MARKVTKSLASATIYGLDATKYFTVDENGFPKSNVTLTVDGNPTQNKARILLEKACGHKNVMVLGIEVDESKISVDAETFYNHSAACVEGVVYGREYVTQVVKLTVVYGFYMDADSGMQTFKFTVFGEVADSKRLKLARDAYGMSCVVTHSEITEDRRYMTREEYLELAR